MSDEISARLGLPYLVAGQLQKHITLNEGLTRLDALVQAAVVSRTTPSPPASPTDGDLYIVPAGATGGVWNDHDAGALLRAEFGAWTAIPPIEGAVIWIADEDQIVVRRDGGWTPLGGLIRELQAVTRIGLNTQADGANPFSAKLNNALWTALAVEEGGDGDLRMTFNKAGASDVLSLLFQSSYGGRAELGLIGDDDLTLKVSGDGSTWRQALAVNRSSGAVVFPAGSGRVETTVLTANATFSIPPWARRLEVVAVGGGGGGGSGAAGVTGTNRFGGGGGGAGGVSCGAWPTSALAASLTVVIGSGGSVGTAVANGSGLTGGAGGASTVISAGATILTARAGGGGAGGSATAGAGGVGGIGAPMSNGGGASSVSGTGAAGAFLTRPDGSGGGGGGGGLDASDLARAGGTGGQGGATSVLVAGGTGGVGSVGGAGAPASTPSLSSASGGGGGGAASTGVGHAGGAGAPGGSGGGGGGAGVTASGAGGAGGAAVVRITAIG